MGKEEPEVPRLVLGPGELDQGEPGSLPSGDEGEPEARFPFRPYGQDFGFNHADAILGIGWKDGEIYVTSEVYVFEKDTEEIIALARQKRIDPRVEMFCDSAEPDRIRTWQKAGFRA